MLIAEFLTDSILWKEALQRAPAVTLQTEEIYRLTDGTVRVYNWIETTDFEAFEDAAVEDPTITDLECIADAGERRLYRADLTPAGEAAMTYSEWADHDITYLDATATAEGWRLTMQFPDRNALTEFRELSREAGETLTLLHLYSEEDGGDRTGSRLTPPQREALLAAEESGFFNVPRDVTQEALAAQLGISEQALSERLRRGMSSLVSSTLQTETDL